MVTTFSRFAKACPYKLRQGILGFILFFALLSTGEAKKLTSFLQSCRNKLGTVFNGPTRLGSLDSPQREAFQGAARFKELAVLGSGTFSIVYKGKDSLRSDETVAVKAFHPMVNPVFLERAKNGARIAQEIRRKMGENSPIVEVKELIEKGDTSLVVMEPIDGLSLEEKIAATLKIEKSKESFAKVLSHLEQVAASAAALEQNGYMHTDLQATNILIEKGTERIVFVDPDSLLNIDSETKLATSEPAAMGISAPETSLQRNGEYTYKDLGSPFMTLSIGQLLEGLYEYSGENIAGLSPEQRESFIKTLQYNLIQPATTKQPTDRISLRELQRRIQELRVSLEK